MLELERRLRVTEPVIKFITVRIDEEEKRLAKVKALRGVRRKLSRGTGRCAGAAPAAPAAEAASPYRPLSSCFVIRRRRWPDLILGTGVGPIQSSAAP